MSKLGETLERLGNYPLGGPMMQGLPGSKPAQDTEARASFRYRLREAARQALTLGDALLQLSQDAVEPSEGQLSMLRDLENSLHVCNDYRVAGIKPKP